MSLYQSIEAEQDWQRFMNIFNRCTVYAPFTVPLSESLIESFIAPFHLANESIARIGSVENGEGIIHAGTYMMNDRTKVGHIYMLLADTNHAAYRLLFEAEQWLKCRNVSKIYGFWWPPNPYNFILHGRETYAWAGAFPANNAFRRLHYDLLNDIIVMQLQMNEEPAVSIPDLPGLEIRQLMLEENELTWSGRIEAHYNNKKIGHCDFYDLKAISAHLKKHIGQITIDTDSQFHGTGLAKAVITYAHQLLYKRGARYVMLATSQGLFRAIKFYEKLGYKAELIRAYSYIKEEDI